MQLRARRVAKALQQNRHDQRTGNADAQNPNHGQVALAELVGSLFGVLGPSRVKGIGRGNTTQVSQARNKSRGRGNPDLAVPTLEDLRAPSHANRHGRAKAKAYHEQAAITCPSVVEGKGSHEQASNLDAYSSREKECSKTVEAVREGSNDENGNEVHLFRFSQQLG